MSNHLLYRFDKRYPLLLRYIVEKRGWRATSGENYNLWWRNSRFPPAKVLSAKSHQRINHFINSGRITKKAGMIYYMKQYRKAYGPQVYNFMPPSLIISPRTDRKLIQLEDDISKRIWIVKPSSSSQGRGIRLIDDLNGLDLGKYYSDWADWSHVTASAANGAVNATTPDAASVGTRKPRTFVVSQYIDNPYLIRGYKHDIRLYVLVTSYHPLEVHLYREGLVRFATKPYDVDNEHVTGPRHESVYRHLTNTSINKFNPMFKQKSDAEASKREMRDFENAMFTTLGYGDLGKRTLRQLFNYFHRQGIDHQPIWDEIKRIILLTLLPLCHLVPKTKAKCFELYGFDILLDNKLKPWLIEVNFSPSLALETVTDQSIKESLLEDVIDTLGFEGMLKGGSSVNRTIPLWEGPTPLHADTMSGNFEKIFPVTSQQADLAQELSNTVTSGPEILFDDVAVDEDAVAQTQELPAAVAETPSPVFVQRMADIEAELVQSICNGRTA